MNKISLILSLIFFLSGCSSVLSRNTQRGYVYAGVNTDTYAIKCLWDSSIWENSEVPWYQWTPIASLGTVVFLIDMPFSFLGDAVLLPIDLNSEQSGIRRTMFTECKK